MFVRDCPTPFITQLLTQPQYFSSVCLVSYVFFSSPYKLNIYLTKGIWAWIFLLLSENIIQGNTRSEQIYEMDQTEQEWIKGIPTFSVCGLNTICSAKIRNQD